MIVAFLRGVTNPPPDHWFTKVETWNKQAHDEGVWVTVPEEAQEALVFLAPETGGGFSTLRTAVRGKPGAFVRAAQDLHQASLDRARLENYLAAMREPSAGGTDQLHERTVLLARSLNFKLEQECFDKPTAQQVPCLTQNTDQLVLDDAHSQTMLSTLTSGAQVDLVAQVGYTPVARSGYYSPYIGAVVDMARILGTTHTAQYQYIPALALPRQNALNLRLNNPPSFRNPKSVLVVGLPPVASAVLPPLRAADAKAVYCIANPDLVLPVEGAPLVFATELGHDFELHLETKAGTSLSLPLTADAERGGFVVNTRGMHLADLQDEFTASVRGVWGFQKFEGPRFPAQSTSREVGDRVERRERADRGAAGYAAPAVGGRVLRERRDRKESGRQRAFDLVEADEGGRTGSPRSVAGRTGGLGQPGGGNMRAARRGQHSAAYVCRGGAVGPVQHPRGR
jgi:hypothetical protein